jgi:hypothetical protein
MKKHPLVKHWLKWKASEEGKRSLEPSILAKSENAHYLENRLYLAFLEGAKAQEKLGEKT